jgi:ABC-2 type transport system ATP-binding protein
MRLIMDVIAPDSGTIRIFGDSLSERIKDRIGYLPEERGLFRKMKVMDTLLFLGALKGMKPADIRIRGGELLARFGLDSYAGHKIEELSKGMAQKLQFIATILHSPELLILDEPFSGLDPLNIELVKDIVLAKKRENVSIIFSTHLMEYAEMIVDTVAMIHEGKKVLDGTLRSIQDKYSSDTLRVKLGDGVDALHNIEGIEKINDFGQIQELRLTPNGNPQKILQEILQRTTVQSFDITKPSLHDIFIRIAGPAAKEVVHA